MSLFLRPLAVVVCCIAILSTTSPSFASAKFRKWISDFENVAARNGVKRSVYRAAFKGIRSPDPEVVELARYQPEFRQKLWMYFDTRVNEEGIARGLEEKQRWAPWLDRIEREYGVSRNVLLGIWSMETGFGEALKKGSATRNIVRSLATLAYADRKRR
ncbi:MAG: lytic murein transglycosylase, partial [Pseudomonadota bacterium]